MLGASLLLDAAVRPRRGGRRQWQGWVLHALAIIALFGLILAGSGNFPVSALLTAAIMTLLTITSNAKYAMLGEPLLFSDLALVAGVFRHPRFYLTALTPLQRWGLGLGAPLFLLALGATFRPYLAPHLMGAALCVGAGLGARWAARRFADLVSPADIDADVARLGLIATLLLYWQRWKATPDPAECLRAAVAHPDRPELIVIVQCESFADPVALTGDAALALPALERARRHAWQWGELGVSGFGAYTMRTEYGVIFGRSEEALGFRRFDPFLTALGERTHALPAKLADHGYRSFFVHPHDMRFYGRDRLMPAVGFTNLIGESSFPAPESGSRYVGDRMLGASLAELVGEAVGPTLIYAVTMENHGPWIRESKTGSPGGLDAYLHHLRNSDAMLADLIDCLSAAGKSGLLVFFGDHRPSVPGVTKPGGDRHTPYVMMRFTAAGELLTREDGPIDLTPAALHHAVLNCVRPD